MSFPNTINSSWRKVLDTNSANGTALTGKAGTATKPEGTGIIVPNAAQNNSLVVIPLHDGATNNTYNMTINGYSAVSIPDAAPLYVGGLLVDMLCQNSTLTAVIDGTTFQLPDTLTLTKGDSSVHIVSPGGDFGGYFIVDTYGFSYLEFEFDDIDDGNMNAIVRWI